MAINERTTAAAASSRESQAAELHAALDCLADQLITPIIPGEAPQWLATACKFAERVNALQQRHASSVQEDEYAQIVEADPELFRRVEQMKEKDRECSEQLAGLLDRLKIVQALVQRTEPDEAVAAKALEGIVNLGLELVNHMRMQEKARVTWLSEAYYRVRGTVD